jgi:hypothetical protein
MTPPRDWADLAANPDAFGDKEKSLWLKVEPVLGELLDELKSNGKVETVLLPAETDDLGIAIRTQQNCAMNYNRLINASKSGAFVDALAPFGFNQFSTADLFVQTAILLTILTSELFRTLLLFHTKGLNPKGSIGSMLNELKGVGFAPNAVTKLEDYVDVDFRNALAHGLVGTKDKKIVLYRNSKFEILEIMGLADFIMRSKTQSVLAQCLINLIVERKRAGFFQSP